METLQISLEDVQRAVVVLQSIGVKVICHGLDREVSLEPFLPHCKGRGYGDFNNQLENDLTLSLSTDSADYHYLRGTAAMMGRQNHARRFLEVKHHFDSLQEQEAYYAYNIVGALFCVGSVALIAGLFLGLLTLDVLQLRIIQRTSIDEDEKLYARTVLPIVEKRHLLLVTLLLMNALAYESMPIFLDALVPSWVAILLSTTLVMFFGEILPSGLFMGPNQLYLGYKLAPLTRFFLWIMYPFAKPLAMCLDFLVGEEDGDNGGQYHRGELSALVRIQYEDSRGSIITKKKSPPKPRVKDDSWHATKQEIFEKANERFDNQDVSHEEEQDPGQQLAPPLHSTEVDLIEGALQMKTVLVMDVYTPLSHLYAISDDLVLDRKGFTGIYRQGYSRVPVYRKKEENPDEKTNILGFFMVRQLMLIDWDHKREVSTLPLQQPRCVSPRMNLVDALKILRSKGYLMAFVCARPDLGNKAIQANKPLPSDAGFMGIVTLEDIMESLLQERIYDEWDIRDRDRAVATLQKWAATKLQDFMRKKAKTLKDKRPRVLHPGFSEASHDESAPLLNVAKGQNCQYSYVQS